MSNRIQAKMDEILGAMGKPLNDPFAGVVLRDYANEVMQRITHPNISTSTAVINALVAKANNQNLNVASGHFSDMRRKALMILIEVWIEDGQFRDRIAHPKTRTLMEAYDTDPRDLAYEITAEIWRIRPDLSHDYPHAGLHLFPGHEDQIVFFSSEATDFDVHFQSDPDYGPEPTNTFRSLFDWGVLECRGGLPVATGPARLRNGQRFFKYTIVSPGEDPGQPAGPGKPAHLDPHVAGHDSD